jgi:hypothetical protein
MLKATQERGRGLRAGATSSKGSISRQNNSSSQDINERLSQHPETSRLSEDIKMRCKMLMP